MGMITALLISVIYLAVAALVLVIGGKLTRMDDMFTEHGVAVVAMLWPIALPFLLVMATIVWGGMFLLQLWE